MTVHVRQEAASYFQFYVGALIFYVLTLVESVDFLSEISVRRAWLEKRWVPDGDGVKSIHMSMRPGRQRTPPCMPPRVARVHVRVRVSKSIRLCHRCLGTLACG